MQGSQTPRDALLLPALVTILVLGCIAWSTSVLVGDVPAQSLMTAAASGVSCAPGVQPSDKECTGTPLAYTCDYPQKKKVGNTEIQCMRGKQCGQAAPGASGGVQGTCQCVQSCKANNPSGQPQGGGQPPQMPELPKPPQDSQGQGQQQGQPCSTSGSPCPTSGASRGTDSSGGAGTSISNQENGTSPMSSDLSTSPNSAGMFGQLSTLFQSLFPGTAGSPATSPESTDNSGGTAGSHDNFGGTSPGPENFSGTAGSPENFTGTAGGAESSPATSPLSQELGTANLDMNNTGDISQMFSEQPGTSPGSFGETSPSTSDLAPTASQNEQSNTTFNDNFQNSPGGAEPSSTQGGNPISTAFNSAVSSVGSFFNSFGNLFKFL